MSTQALELLDVLSSRSPVTTTPLLEQHKLAYLRGGAGGESWLSKYVGTPLFDQASTLEQQSLLVAQQRLEFDAARPKMDQFWDMENQIRVQQDMLDLQLMQLRQQEQAAATAPAAPEGPAPTAPTVPPEGMLPDAAPKTASFFSGMAGKLRGFGQGVAKGMKGSLVEAAPELAHAAAAPATARAMEHTRGKGLSRLGELLTGSRAERLGQQAQHADAVSALGGLSPTAAAVAHGAAPAIEQELQREATLSNAARAALGLGALGLGGLTYGAVQDYRMENPNNFVGPPKVAAMSMPGFLSGFGQRAAHAAAPAAAAGPSLAQRLRGLMPQSATQRMQQAYKATPTQAYKATPTTLGSSVAQQTARAGDHRVTLGDALAARGLGSSVAQPRVTLGDALAARGLGSSVAQQTARAGEHNLDVLRRQVAHQRGVQTALPTAAQQTAARSAATPGHSALMQSYNLPQVNQAPRLAPPKVASFNFGNALSSAGKSFSKANKATGGRLGMGIATGVVGGGLAGGMSGNDGFSLSRAAAGALGGGALGAVGGNVAHQMSKGQGFTNALGKGLSSAGSQATGMYNSAMKGGTGLTMAQRLGRIASGVGATGAAVAGAAKAAPETARFLLHAGRLTASAKNMAQGASDTYNTLKGTVSSVRDAANAVGPGVRQQLQGALSSIGADKAYDAMRSRIMGAVQA